MKKLLLADLVEAPISGEWGVEPTDGNGIKIIRTTNFTNEGRLNLSNVVVRDIEAKKIEKKKLQYGDIIIEKSGGSPTQPVGRVVFFDMTDDVYLCNNFTAVLRPKEGIYPKYLFYIMYGLHLTKATLAFQNKTTGIINLKLNNYLTKVKIPLPPLEEQKHIAEVLDKADRLRQKDRQLLAHYDQLLQSVFLDTFGDLDLNDKEWKEKELGEVLANIQIGPFGSLLHVEDYVTGGVPLVNPTHIKSLKIQPDNNFTVSPEKLENLKNYRLKAGDVILGRRGEMGRCALVTEKEDGWLCGTGSLFLTPSNNISSVYLTYLLSRESVKKRLEKEAKGTTMPNLNRTIIRNFKVPVPPIEIQEKFAAFTFKLKHQLELLQKNVNLTELLFQSLLEKAFKGELQLKEVKKVEESLV